MGAARERRGSGEGAARERRGSGEGAARERRGSDQTLPQNGSAGLFRKTGRRDGSTARRGCQTEGQHEQPKDDQTHVREGGRDDQTLVREGDRIDQIAARGMTRRLPRGLNLTSTQSGLKNALLIYILNPRVCTTHSIFFSTL